MFRLPQNTDLFTIAFLTCLGLIAIAKFKNGKRLYSYLSLLFSSSYLVRYNKDIKFFDIFGILTFLIFNISIGLLIIPFGGNYLDYSGLESILIIFFSVTFFFGLKFIFEIVLSKLLNIQSFAKIFLFRKISYRNFYAIVLLPILAYLYYHSLFQSDIAKYLLITIFIFYVLSYLIVIRSLFEVIKQNWFYFILYICALEIAPYLILFKCFEYY